VIVDKKKKKFHQGKKTKKKKRATIYYNLCGKICLTQSGTVHALRVKNHLMIRQTNGQTDTTNFITQI